MSTELVRHCLRLLLALSLSISGGHAIASVDAAPGDRDGIGASETVHHGQPGHHARSSDAPPAPQADHDQAQPFKRRRVESDVTPSQAPPAAGLAPSYGAIAAVPLPIAPAVPTAVGFERRQARFLRACRGRAPPAA